MAKGPKRDAISRRMKARTRFATKDEKVKKEKK